MNCSIVKVEISMNTMKSRYGGATYGIWSSYLFFLKKIHNQMTKDLDTRINKNFIFTRDQQEKKVKFSMG